MAHSIDPSDQPAPYQAAAGQYWEAGWRGILPLPAGQKQPPPTGWTGWNAPTPSWPDIYAWTEDHPTGNIGLHLPPGILGIDVDAYDDKPGAATFATCQQQWGPLPDTWRSTSRDDGVSGIRLYLIPEGLDWPGQLPGGGVELIHTGHRYVVAWPSIHPEGRTYRWITPDGVPSLAVPDPAALPALPAGWIIGLARGNHDGQAKADMNLDQTAEWIDNLPGAHDTPCNFITSRTDSTLAALGDNTGRHDTIRDRILALVRFGAQGHPGVVPSLKRIAVAFVQAVTADGSRDRQSATAEWRRMLAGAAQIIAADSDLTEPLGDPCNPPIANINPPPTSQPATAPDRGQDDGEAAESRTSWWPVDLGPVLAGEITEEPPTILARVDGVNLIYPSRINGIIGPSESGKTWIAMLGAAQAIAQGWTVLYLDFEDSAPGIVTRMRNLGVDDRAMLEHLRYMSPDEALSALASKDLNEALAEARPALIVLDGVNAAMTLLGLDLMSNKDATAFHQQVLKPLAASGAGVIYIDHTPKNNSESAGGIGAQAKRAMTTGSALRVEVIKPFGRGQDGLLKLTVDKDRAGHVRAACEDSRTVGMVHIDSDAEADTVEVRIERERPSRDEQGNFRPTTLMRKVSEFLITIPEGASGKAIEEGVQGKRDFIRKAVEQLVIEGYVIRNSGPRGAIIHTLDRVFREDPEAPRPTSPRPRPGDVEGRPRPEPLTGGSAGRGQPAGGRPSPRPGSGTPTNTQWINGCLVDMDTGVILEDGGE